MLTPTASSRLGAAVISRTARSRVAARSFANSAARCKASNFVMPALSPTMTEGNISKWHVKEGDSFSAGDVLLDIETDKAQMDVEAQDEGVLAKIIQPDGSKAIKVGSQIAVMAEEGDDLASLEMPAQQSQERPAPETKGNKDAEKQESSSAPQREEPSQQKTTSPPKGSKQPPQKYPLYPAVQAMLRENGLDLSEAENIPASGPSGRLLKGDVLSYIGKIKREYSAQQSKRISDAGQLDLSQMKKAESKPAQKPAPPPKAEPQLEPELDTEVAVSISLSAVFATQRRVREALGLTLPLSTFIARASEIANESLPRAKQSPTADELYDAVLGLDKLKKQSRGSYTPNVTALAAAPLLQSSPALGNARKQEDVIDVLTGASKAKQKSVTARTPSASGVASSNSTNVFSVNAKKGEEKRARTYLERMKTVLEAEPGRCVL